LLGETVDKYQIIGCLGRGGMADVYKALHPELNRVVALKVLNRALVHSPEMLERFRREARAIAALRHSNVVQVFDLGVADGIYYMVMEYIEGETLARRIKDLQQHGEHMAFAEVLRIGIAIGNALDYAHEQGMLHRDVKPANIMFRDDGSIVLTDFGVAKILDAASDLTASGAVAGTPAYMAPEQWTADEPDRRSDIYSLGVVLYELATGELPFSADTPGRLMFKHISESPPPPRDIYADISPELETIILRALAKDADDRYQTAQELVEDLEHTLYRVESTAPTGIFQRTVSLPADNGAETRADSASRAWNRHSPLLWISIGVVLVLSMIVIGALLLNTGGSDTPDGMDVATSDATGTALYVRLMELEATLTASAMPSMAPLETSGPTLSPTWSPSPSLTPVMPSKTMSQSISLPTETVDFMAPSASPVCDYTMTLLENVNYSSEIWWSPVNTRFEKVWEVFNAGDCAWPEDTVLVHLDGEPFGLEAPFEVESLEGGERMTLSVVLQTPATPDLYQGRFQLQTRQGGPIGEPLLVKLEVRAAGATDASLEIAGWELIEWHDEPAQYIWKGKLRFSASGGTGRYVWYRDTLDNPLPGNVLEFEWGICRDFYGSIWVTSGEEVAHQSLHVPYPGGCD
jgi:serine/threonine-protein kinase